MANQARIWLAVKPSTGVPLLLGAVVVSAVIVHFAILTHTTWFSAYWEGGSKAAKHAAAAAAPAPDAPAAAK